MKTHFFTFLDPLDPLKGCPARRDIDLVMRELTEWANVHNHGKIPRCTVTFREPFIMFTPQLTPSQELMAAVLDEQILREVETENEIKREQKDVHN